MQLDHDASLLGFEIFSSVYFGTFALGGWQKIIATTQSKYSLKLQVALASNHLSDYIALMPAFRLETPRLILRQWREEDIDPFHGICSDPVVMETLGPLMNRDEVAALVARMYRMQEDEGHCFWAMERKVDRRLIGWCGIIRGRPGTSIDGKLEAGWRMTPSAWGKGYVTEAAVASVQWAFDNLPDDAVWAITNTDNRRSRAVMERIGMTYDPALDFDHPQVPADSPLLRHVTYRIGRDEWARNRANG